MNNYKIEGPSFDLTIVPSEGESFNACCTDQRFCDFLTWASGPAGAAVRALDPDFQHLDSVDEGIYFSDHRALLEKCIESGLLLHAIQEDDRWNIPNCGSFFWESAATLRGNEFVQLWKRVSGEPGVLHGITGPGVTPSSIFVEMSLWSRLVEDLDNGSTETSKVFDVPRTMSFVYLDVSDFSQYSPIEQALIINSINSLSRRAPNAALANLDESFEGIKARLCIGDGYIFCFEDPMFATFFAGVLASQIELGVARKTISVEFHFRMGVHTGPVFHFWDPGRDSWNYIGEGINGGSRVLESIGKDVDDVLFLSAEVRQQLVAGRAHCVPYPQILKTLINRGRRKDKHGNVWRVYELNHPQFAELLHML